MPRSSQATMVWAPSAASVTSMTPSPAVPGPFYRHEQPSWGFAHLHAPGAFPPAGKQACAVLTADSQVALHVAVPAGQAVGIGDCRPQVVDIGVEAVLHAHDALAVCRSQ